MLVPSHSETAGVDAAQKWLESCGYPQDKIEIIKRIIHGVSFKNELATGAADVFPELAVVQDADRFDCPSFLFPPEHPEYPNLDLSLESMLLELLVLPEPSPLEERRTELFGSLGNRPESP